MSVLSAQSIKYYGIITPFAEKTLFEGKSYGLSSCGYDIRIKQPLILPPGAYKLGSSIERFDMPNFIMGQVADKSSWARQGVVVQNTIIEPGWHGYLTLEVANHGATEIVIVEGSPIAQIVFFMLDEPTKQPYTGKYQNQPDRPVESIYDAGKPT